MLPRSKRVKGVIFRGSRCGMPFAHPRRFVNKLPEVK
jgi:hypothetical protein